jgi:hypothetical protein
VFNFHDLDFLLINAVYFFPHVIDNSPKALSSTDSSRSVVESVESGESGYTIPIYSFLAFYRLSLASTFGSKALQDDQKTMVRRAGGARYVHAFACH